MASAQMSTDEKLSFVKDYELHYFKNLMKVTF